jgi:hypothetical protein
LKARGGDSAIVSVAGGGSPADSEQPIDKETLDSLLAQHAEALDACLEAYRAASKNELEELFEVRENGAYACQAIPGGLLQLTLASPSLGLMTDEGPAAITFQFAAPDD